MSLPVTNDTAHPERAGETEAAPGLFGMGAAQRLVLSAVLSALLTAAAWWALAG